MRAIPFRNKIRERRGSSLLLVMATIGVLLAFWGMAYRMTASLIRVESSLQSHQMHTEQTIHSMTALDRALTLLEVSKPTIRQKYVYKLDLVLPDTTHKLFTITYTPYDSPADLRDGLDANQKKGWTVNVSPDPYVGAGSILALPAPTLNLQWLPSPQ
jgi:hypothetical protein